MQHTDQGKCGLNQTSYANETKKFTYTDALLRRFCEYENGKKIIKKLFASNSNEIGVDMIGEFRETYLVFMT